MQLLDVDGGVVNEVLGSSFSSLVVSNIEVASAAMTTVAADADGVECLLFLLITVAVLCCCCISLLCVVSSWLWALA